MMNVTDTLLRLPLPAVEAMLLECDPETAAHIGRAASWIKHRVKFTRWLATAKRELATLDGGARNPPRGLHSRG